MLKGYTTPIQRRRTTLGHEYYFTAVKSDQGELSMAGVSKEQLQRILQVTPGTEPTNQWSMSIADNTLVATIVLGPIIGSYDRYYLTVDDDVAPTLSSDGVAGAVPGTYTLSQWGVSYTFRLWVYQSNTWNLVTPTNPDGSQVPGILISSNDTYGYIWQQGATSIAFGTDHTTDIVVTVDTPPVANIPQTGTLLYNLWDNISQTKLRSNVASPISYTSPVAGVSLQCYVTIADGAGKITSSTDPYGGTAGYLPITLETPANGFVAIELSSYSVDEDAGPFVPTFVLVDENGDPLNATGDVTFDVTTISRTALSGDTLSFDTTSDIDTGTDVISITGHGLVDGDAVCTAMKGGSATPGYTDHETYYVNAPSVDTLTLHTSFADACSWHKSPLI